MFGITYLQKQEASMIHQRNYSSYQTRFRKGENTIQMIKQSEKICNDRNLTICDIQVVHGVLYQHQYADI